MKPQFKGTPGPWYIERHEYDGGYKEVEISAVIDPIHGHSTTICIMSDYEEDQREVAERSYSMQEISDLGKEIAANFGKYFKIVAR